ncbi:MAG: helix-turn-helix transcriptional regulator [Lachnospiraceae bacterium]|jgi:transcriptional regulator with XRE-family HTH domain|nr:helix-turn-helix transcriptional regulator [Lachnospiraceae bacterium]
MNIYIGENIKRLRLNRQITQEQLSVAMSVSCAAVSKWERGETLPDISLLPLLAHYFSVSIDELMGYDAARIEEEIQHFMDEHGRLFRAGKREEYTRLSEKAYREYPNDYRVINYYMWDKVGDYTDNDPQVLLANQDELLFLCRRTLEGCADTFLRMDAVNMQGKILHAQGRTQEAVALYKKEIPDWYLTCGQKTEQLFAKDTPEYARQLRFNLLELGAFTVNKKCSELWFCHGLSLAEKGEAALELCAALEQLRRTVFCGETDYYLGGFASGMARKLRKAGGDEAVAERLCRIGQEAMERFRAYSESDPAAREVLNCDFMDFP